MSAGESRHLTLGMHPTANSVAFICETPCLFR